MLKIIDIKKHFQLKGGFLSRSKGILKAVDGVSLQIRKGDIFGLAGESGCGKTTLGYVAGGILPQTEGTIHFEGQPIDDRSGKLTVRDVQFIFQDISGALNPKWMIKDIIAEPLAIIGETAQVRREKTERFMKEVGLTLEYLDAYPHELSGGQRQRVSIARAMVTNPKLIVCDEPFSALDVSVQAQIISLLIKLKRQFDLTYLIISHDLALLQYICNVLAVMYLGEIVEEAVPAEKLFTNPLHPYSQGLLGSFLFADPNKQRIDAIEILAGEVPNPILPPQGCRFHPRCKHCRDICRKEKPVMREIDPGHRVACHFVQHDGS
ncbi:MAG: ABC transporter ATP-binding protein [Deltaproteobacteria bacterium]|nr:ABC transporter ATP-binding protein [Deltaproteobacteria bacterium]